MTPESSHSQSHTHTHTQKPASSLRKIKPVSSNLTVKEEAPHGNQETDDLKPVFPDNDCNVKHSYYCKVRDRLFDFFKICSLLHQKYKEVLHVCKFYQIAYHII